MNQTPTEFMQQYLSNGYDLEAIVDLIDDGAIYFFSNHSAHIGKAQIASAIKKNFDTIKDDDYHINNLT
jgi:ketosteroid isomerase-like protein